MPLTQLSDGRWIARWYEDGRKSSRYLSRILGQLSATEAEKEYRRLLVDADRLRARRDTSPDLITFRSLSSQYLAQRSDRMAPASLKRHTSVIKAMIETFGDVPVAELDPLVIERYLGSRSRETSKATANRELVVFRAVLRWGERKLQLGETIRTVVEPFDLENHGVRIVYLEPEEWRRLITAFDNPERWRAYLTEDQRKGRVVGGTRVSQKARVFGGSRKPDSPQQEERRQRLQREMIPLFHALLYTGARLGDVLMLRWEQIDFRRATITFSQKKSGGTVTVVPISDALRAILKSLQRRGDYVFSRADGEPHRTMDAWRAFVLARDLAGLRAGLSPHALRHTLGSWLAQAGESLLTIQKLLGHASPAITARHYAHLMPNHLKAAADKVAEIAAGNVRATSPSTHDRK
jgi:integrase